MHSGDAFIKHIMYTCTLNVHFLTHDSWTHKTSIPTFSPPTKTRLLRQICSRSVVSSSVIATLSQLICYNCLVIAALLQPLCYSCFVTAALLQELCYSRSITAVFLQPLSVIAVPATLFHQTNRQIAIDNLLQLLSYGCFVTAALLQLLCYRDFCYSCSSWSVPTNKQRNFPHLSNIGHVWNKNIFLNM